MERFFFYHNLSNSKTTTKKKYTNEQALPFIVYEQECNYSIKIKFSNIPLQLLSDENFPFISVPLVFPVEITSKLTPLQWSRYNLVNFSYKFLSHDILSRRSKNVLTALGKGIGFWRKLILPQSSFQR